MFDDLLGRASWPIAVIVAAVAIAVAWFAVEEDRSQARIVQTVVSECADEEAPRDCVKEMLAVLD
jgi:hypothetical protein